MNGFNVWMSAIVILYFVFDIRYFVFCILYLIYGILYLIYGEFVFCICMMFLIVLGPSAKLNGFNQDKSVWTAAIVILPLLEEVPRPPQTLLYFSQTVLYFSTLSLLCITFVFSV